MEEVAAVALVVAEIEMVGIGMEVVVAIAMEVVAVADMTEIEMGEEEVDMEVGEVEAQTEEAMEEIETDHTDHCDCTLLGGVTLLRRILPCFYSAVTMSIQHIDA